MYTNRLVDINLSISISASTLVAPFLQHGYNVNTMNNIRPEIRTFVLGTVALSTTTWNIAFNLGAYRTVFYRNLFVVWVTVTTIFLVTLLTRKREVPVPWWGKVIMLVPTAGIILLPLAAGIGQDTLWEPAALTVSVFAVLICLPYALYVAVRIINADLLDLPEMRLKVLLVAIVLIVGLIGLWMGANNDLFLTCGDFKIAGDELPANCRPGPPVQY